MVVWPVWVIWVKSNIIKLIQRSLKDLFIGFRHFSVIVTIDDFDL